MGMGYWEYGILHMRLAAASRIFRLAVKFRLAEFSNSWSANFRLDKKIRRLARAGAARMSTITVTLQKNVIYYNYKLLFYKSNILLLQVTDKCNTITFSITLLFWLSINVVLVWNCFSRL